MRCGARVDSLKVGWTQARSNMSILKTVEADGEN